MDAADAAPASHVVFVVHGLSATTEDVRPLCEALARHHAARGVRVVAARANEGALWSLFSTVRGVDDGGARLAAEVAAWLARPEHAAVRRVSFAGHSLGGVYIRAAAARLPPHVELVNFVSFASPHAGVRRFVGRGALDGLLARGLLLGQTGRDMVLSSSGLGWAGWAGCAAAP